MTWTSDARSVNGWVLCGFWKAKGRALFETTLTNTFDRDRYQLSIKKRTTKKGGDGEERCALAWVCSSSGVHDPRCDHSRTHGLRIYPGSVAGVRWF